MTLKQFCNKNVRIIDTSGKVFAGRVTDYFYPEDNENGKESIVIDSSSGALVEFYETDIRDISIVTSRQSRLQRR